MRRLPLVRSCAAAAVALGFVAPAGACINGEKFHPHVARPAKPDGFLPKAPSPKAGDLKALRPRGVPPPELPVMSPPPIVFTAPEPPSFDAYVTEFEAARMSPLNRTYGRRIDYSVALIRLGRVKDAIAELRALEKAFPGNYKTAANLGTAYELDGKLEDAITWITRGIERNPDSHAGTEWLHVAILRAKLKLKSDPAWLAKHSVLEGFEARTREEIVQAIEHQLNERLVFVQPVDAVVCDLFFQAAERLDVTQPGMAERRAEYLRASLRFGAWRKAEAERALKG